MMAKIRTRCNCGAMLAADERLAGKIVRCPACGRPVQVHSSPGAPASGRNKVGKAALSETSLGEMYGAVLQERARRKRVRTVLDESARRRRKRNLVIGGSAALALLASFVCWQCKLFCTYGPPLGPLKSYPEVARPFLSGLKRSDVRVRAAATWEVADAAGVELAALVAKMAEADIESEPLVRIVALRSLGRIRGSGVAEQVRPLLDDRDLDVRMTAAFILGASEAGDPDMRALAPHVMKALGADLEWAEWFQRVTQPDVLPDDAAKFLEAKACSESVATRRTAAWMIAATLGADFLLMPLLRDPDPSVSASAIYALEPFLSAEAFEGVEPRKNSEGVLRQRRALLNGVLLKFQPPRRRHADVVVPDVSVRRAAALVLARVGRFGTALSFEPALRDKDWFVRFAALKGLSATGPKLAGEAIDASRLHQRGENEWVRRALARALQGPQQKPNLQKEPE